MARFFKYKSPADVVADARRMGLDLSMSDDFSVLFTALEFGHLRAGNRLAIQPMEGCDGTLEGHPDQLTFRRYRRFGAGGAKIIWGEATAVVEEGRMNPRQLWLNDNTAASIEKMLAVCREAHRSSIGDDDGLVIGLQLTHSGRYSYRKPLPVTHDPVLDPLTVDKSTGKRLDDSYQLMSDDQLKRLEDDYLAAVGLAHKLGVDFVDIKQCHRYLLSELLSARNRAGDYGGSFENRTRLIRNIVNRVRDEFPRVAIATRFNAYDGIPYRAEGDESIGKPCPHRLPLQTAFGTDPNDHAQEELSEPLRLARCLKEWGVCLMNVSMGNPYANPHVVRPAEFAPVDGYQPPEHPLVGVARHFRITRQIQTAVPDVPIVGSGYSWLQDYCMHAAAANISSGQVAVAGFGRATLSQPDFVKNVQDSGRLDRKAICRTFSYCTNLMRSKDHPLGQYATGCPPFDKEVYGPLWKEAEAKLNHP